MRVLLDTNILISALMARGTPPDRIYRHWKRVTGDRPRFRANVT
jgi:predicted nucleic acid-binding protein